MKQFKCQSCGAYLQFDPTKSHMTCPYCDSEVQMPKAEAVEEAIPEEAAQRTLRGYHCSNCGAEIVTGETTAATRCYFCHSPVVLTDRLSEEYRPDAVVPFALDHQAAEAAFKKFIASKKFVDKKFFSQAQLEDFSGVYYPYWLGEMEGEGDFDGTGTQVSRMETRHEIITTTRYFHVTRSGRFHFPGLVRRALTKTDAVLSDLIFPFDTAKAAPYIPQYLSGFLAERRDVEQKDAETEMASEVRETAPNLISRSGKYNSLSGKTDFRITNSKMKYVLLPAWVLTYQYSKSGVKYYYMMNGQTGKVVGKLPIDKKKLWLNSLMTGAIIAVILCLGGAFIW